MCNLFCGCFYPVDYTWYGKVAIVTGGNRGCGFNTALALVQKGMRVIIACRSEISGKKAAEMINSLSCVGSCEYLVMDLCYFDSVRNFATEFEKLGVRVDVLVNSAAIMANPYTQTKNGMESQFQTNHLGHFLLTNLLLPKMSKHARIVNVSSIAHLAGGIIDIEKLKTSQDGNRYDPWDAYCISKSANILFTYGLQKRLADTKIVVNACHPGILITGLWKYNVPALLAVGTCSTQIAGSKPIVYAATGWKVASTAGYFVSLLCCYIRIPTSFETYDTKAINDLWTYSEECVAIKSDLQDKTEDYEEPSYLMMMLSYLAYIPCLS